MNRNFVRVIFVNSEGKCMKFRKKNNWLWIVSIKKIFPLTAHIGGYLDFMTQISTFCSPEIRSKKGQASYVRSFDRLRDNFLQNAREATY